jgi:putative SOS response-associated peptidase YedK
MCGRFALTLELDALMEAFPGFIFPQDLAPRYNIAPTQPVPVIPNDKERQVKLFHWGLVPFWAKDPAIGNRMINARAETLAEKPSFRAAYQSRRCLVLTDGFYEWRKEAGRRAKTPYFIQLASGDPFAFAGLWEVWKGGDAPLYSCTIITTEPNAVVAPIHDRMPVILPSSAYDLWLDPDEHNTEILQGLLKPYTGSDMVAYEVSTMVNNPSNDRHECVEPVAER